MNKKKILLISSVLLTLSLICIIAFSNINNKENNIISNITKEEPVINSNMITMMYETEAGSGEYIETKDNTWPESGYIFNEALSGCENGGELEYNSGNNTVNLLSNSSDRCYVYFDKYDGVWIDNVSITNVTGSSITLDVSATSENGNITTYYYALNDSEEYIESTTNPIVINNLNKLTEYNIKIYAIDNIGAKSNIYEINVSTTDKGGPIVNFALINEITSNSISLTLEVDSENTISNYYYSSDNGLSYTSSISSTYTFSNLNKNTTYNISIYVEDSLGKKSNTYNFKITTKDSTYFAEYIKNLYETQGTNVIYHHTNSLANSADDNSYRYAGASSNVNNYVCFDSTTTCSSDYLYRIIGVFDNKVKLIKSTSFGQAVWDSGRDNTWNSSTKPDIYIKLNNDFYNSFNSIWQDKISTYDWQVGGITRNNYETMTTKDYYDVEAGRLSSNISDNMKIGLMYVSDYGFAASPTNWGTAIYNYNKVTNDNWLYSGLMEWTITRSSTESSWYVFYIHSGGGHIGDTFGYNGLDYTMNYRPCFYLNSDVQYISGTGTESDPFRIA